MTIPGRSMFGNPNFTFARHSSLFTPHPDTQILPLGHRLSKRPCRIVPFPAPIPSRASALNACIAD